MNVSVEGQHGDRAAGVHQNKAFDGLDAEFNGPLSGFRRHDRSYARLFCLDDAQIYHCPAGAPQSICVWICNRRQTIGQPKPRTGVIFPRNGPLKRPVEMTE
jgi:hypothetical protein